MRTTQLSQEARAQRRTAPGWTVDRHRSICLEVFYDFLLCWPVRKLETICFVALVSVRLRYPVTCDALYRLCFAIFFGFSLASAESVRFNSSAVGFSRYDSCSVIGDLVSEYGLPQHSPSSCIQTLCRPILGYSISSMSIAYQFLHLSCSNVEYKFASYHHVASCHAPSARRVDRPISIDFLFLDCTFSHNFRYPHRR